MQPQRRQPTRLPHPWDSPGKNTRVGFHFLLQSMKVKSESEVAQLCLTLRNPMDCSPPGSSAHGIFQARVLEWVAIAFSLLSLPPSNIWIPSMIYNRYLVTSVPSLSCATSPQNSIYEQRGKSLRCESVVEPAVNFLSALDYPCSLFHWDTKHFTCIPGETHSKGQRRRKNAFLEVHKVSTDFINKAKIVSLTPCFLCLCLNKDTYTAGFWVWAEGVNLAYSDTSTQVLIMQCARRKGENTDAVISSTSNDWVLRCAGPMINVGDSQWWGEPITCPPADYVEVRYLGTEGQSTGSIEKRHELESVSGNLLGDSER